MEKKEEKEEDEEEEEEEEDDEGVEDDNNKEGHEWLVAYIPHAVCWTRELGGTPGKHPQDTPWHRPSETTEIKQIQPMQKKKDLLIFYDFLTPPNSNKNL